MSIELLSGTRYYKSRYQIQDTILSLFLKSERMFIQQYFWSANILSKNMPNFFFISIMFPQLRDSKIPLESAWNYYFWHEIQ